MQLTRNGGQGGSESEDGIDYYYNKGQVSGIWRMALSGGTEELILDREVDYMNWFLLRGLAISPSGDWILTNGTSREEADVMYVENFR